MSDRPYTTRALRALKAADEASARLGREYIGTEHLLIGLLEDQMSPAAQLLNHLGVTAERVNALWVQTTGKEM